jgi:hypothetical protein
VRTLCAKPAANASDGRRGLAAVLGVNITHRTFLPTPLPSSPLTALRCAAHQIQALQDQMANAASAGKLVNDMKQELATARRLHDQLQSDKEAVDKQLLKAEQRHSVTIAELRAARETALQREKIGTQRAAEASTQHTKEVSDLQAKVGPCMSS